MKDKVDKIKELKALIIVMGIYCLPYARLLRILILVTMASGIFGTISPTQPKAQTGYWMQYYTLDQ